MRARGPSISTSYITPLFVKMACKQNLDLRCVWISDPGTLGAGAKTRLESRIKKFMPPPGRKASPVYPKPNIAPFVLSEYDGRQNLDLRCVLISDPSTVGAGPKHVSNPRSVIKKLPPLVFLTKKLPRSLTPTTLYTQHKEAPYVINPSHCTHEEAP